MNNKQNINWEERRWITASLILAGCAGNYNNGLIPPPNRADEALFLADCLIKALTSTPPSYCAELYQR